MKEALIVWGGWDGHQPEAMAAFFREMLENEGFNVEATNDFNAFSDVGKSKSMDLIVPCITMGNVEKDWVKNVCEAVANGCGLAGCHGGMCDTFREDTDWAFLTGGTWVAHPGNDKVTYEVSICNTTSPLVEGLEDFEVTSEQYYLHVDPAVEILATTSFPVADGPHTTNGHVDMPVAWTKRYGYGQIYYNSLGHAPETINAGPAREMIRRGFVWAARNREKDNKE